MLKVVITDRERWTAIVVGCSFVAFHLGAWYERRYP